MTDEWTGSWCPQCGPDVSVDEDGCCQGCGCDAVGEGAEEALKQREQLKVCVDALKATPYQPHCESADCHCAKVRAALEDVKVPV